MFQELLNQRQNENFNKLAKEEVNKQIIYKSIDMTYEDDKQERIIIKQEIIRLFNLLVWLESPDL